MLDVARRCSASAAGRDLDQLGGGTGITGRARSSPQRLRVSETTVRTWRRYINHDHVFAELRRRVMLLPGWQQNQLVTLERDRRAPAA